MRRANYEVVSEKPAEPLVIRDVGPWDQFLSVTNAAEDVVAELARRGKLWAGRRLFYYDSEGELDELAHSDGVFTGFKPGPGRGCP